MKLVIALYVLIIFCFPAEAQVICNTNDYGSTVCSDGTSAITLTYGEGMYSTIGNDGSASIYDENTGSTVYNDGTGSYTSDEGITNFSNGRICLEDGYGNTTCY